MITMLHSRSELRKIINEEWKDLLVSVTNCAYSPGNILVGFKDSIFHGFTQLVYIGTLRKVEVFVFLIFLFSGTRLAVYYDNGLGNEKPPVFIRIK
jgi:hypothetical protein